MADHTPKHPVPGGGRPPGRARRIALQLGAALLAVTLLALFVGSRDEGGMDTGGDVASAPVDADAPEAESGATRTTRSADFATSDALSLEESAMGGGPAEELPSSIVPTLAERAVVRTGSLSLTSDEVADARQQVINAIEALGGYVANEESSADDEGGLRRTDLSLQVPTDQFAGAMSQVATAGTVVARTQSARDVTEQVVDVQTRVRSAQASLRRIRLLLGRAVSLGDVIRLEQVLSSRQADLESLLAQQESLAAKTELAALRVSISLPPKKLPPVHPEEEETGFFPGLARGWDALSSGYVTLATAVGTALPTLLVLLVVALIGRAIARRFRRGAVSAGSAAESAA